MILRVLCFEIRQKLYCLSIDELDSFQIENDSLPLVLLQQSL